MESSNSYLLDELFKNKKAYGMIQSYSEEKYNIIHNYFTKNNMEIIIKNVLKSFDSNDFIKIVEMENYYYKRMGEIYSRDNKLNEEEQKNNSLVDFLIIKEQNNYYNLKEINLNLLSFFGSLVYINSKFSKSTCIIYYKIGFELLSVKCKYELAKRKDKEIYRDKNISVNVEEKNSKENEDIKESKLDLELITNTLTLLFSNEKNIELFQNKKIFGTMLSSLKILLLYILSKESTFVFRNIQMLKELFNKFNFIYIHLSVKLEKIFNFMKNPNKAKDINKFNKTKNKLEGILDILLIVLEFKKLNKDILNREIYLFKQDVIKKTIKLLLILLELQNEQTFEVINILIEFLFYLIKGPDIKNINLLFSLGFLDLVTYVIRDIDYYKIFLNYINNDYLYKIIDNYAIIECKIMKIFIIYFNISYGNNSMEEFETLQNWYETNFDLIKNKLKRLYYISKKEMEKREYNIDKMLLFIKEDDNYNNSELKIRENISHNYKKEFYEIII